MYINYIQTLYQTNMKEKQYLIYRLLILVTWKDTFELE